MSEQPEPAGLAVQVIRGEPTAEEVAALVVVLSAVAGGSSAGEPPAPTSLWASGARARTAPMPGAGAWRASGLPR
ncbi:acyl-CoA carboxylase subunit epsilon [Angustibacter luteus]|uniref:Acyl-CoA carboxylase subunit epsilon n=1 Tax=Angustibacter luteus TaxID=658456 RepID=A0ABW1JGR7_9ACTN